MAHVAIKPGDRVALLVPGSVDYVRLVLGLLAAGIFPVPLDPRLTPRERSRILEDVDPVLVVDHAELMTSMLERSPEDLRGALPLARPIHVTSGTTGRPKAVWSGILSPDRAQALVEEERELWGFEADDVNLVLSPLYHSAPLRFAMGT